MHPLSTTAAAIALGTTSQTVRRLIADGTLRATRQKLGQRFAWRVDPSSVAAHLTEHGRYDAQSNALEARVAALEARLRPASDGETAALAGRVTDLEEAFALTRLAAERHRAADEARGEAMRAVLDALGAAERADEMRRAASAAMEEALGVFTRPADLRALAT